MPAWMDSEITIPEKVAEKEPAQNGICFIQGGRGQKTYLKTKPLFPK